MHRLSTEKCLTLGKFCTALVGVVRKHYGPGWPEHVAVLNPSVIERMDLLALQKYPKLIMVPLPLAVFSVS